MLKGSVYVKNIFIWFVYQVWKRETPQGPIDAEMADNNLPEKIDENNNNVDTITTQTCQCSEVTEIYF